MTMEALLRAARKDFSPEVLDELHRIARCLTETPATRLRTSELSRVMRLSVDYRKSECLKALRAARSMIDPGLTPWQTAKLLSTEIDRFERRILPILRNDPDYPLTDFQERLRVAFFCKVPFPRTREGLYKEL